MGNLLYTDIIKSKTKVFNVDSKVSKPLSLRESWGRLLHDFAACSHQKSIFSHGLLSQAIWLMKTIWKALTIIAITYKALLDVGLHLLYQVASGSKEGKLQSANYPGKYSVSAINLFVTPLWSYCLVPSRRKERALLDEYKQHSQVNCFKLSLSRAVS